VHILTDRKSRAARATNGRMIRRGKARNLPDLRKCFAAAALERSSCGKNSGTGNRQNRQKMTIARTDCQDKYAPFCNTVPREGMKPGAATEVSN
jgi:hypothetical protein